MMCINVNSLTTTMRRLRLLSMLPCCPGQYSILDQWINSIVVRGVANIERLDASEVSDSIPNIYTI